MATSLNKERLPKLQIFFLYLPAYLILSYILNYLLHNTDTALITSGFIISSLLLFPKFIEELYQAKQQFGKNLVMNPEYIGSLAGFLFLSFICACILGGLTELIINFFYAS